MSVTHSHTITISGSDGTCFDWSATGPIGAVMVKAGQGFNVWHYSPQALADMHLCGCEGKEVSHVTFCWNPEESNGQWCSPGDWRQEHHLDSWTATGFLPEDSFYDKLGYYPTLSKQGQRAGATSDPSLWMVLQSPQFYGGDAFNAVGDLLSTAHPDVNFSSDRVEDSCPLY